MGKLIIEQKKERKRSDSFWYDGVIARLDNCILVANGEIRVLFPDESFYRKNGDAVSEAYKRNYTDSDLLKLKFENNNWFEVISDKGEDILGDARYTYKEGIKLLKSYVKEKIYSGEGVKK